MVLDELLANSDGLVRKNLVEAWRDYVKRNTKDFYSAGVVEASIKVMKALSEGKTPEEAEKSIDGVGISGFMIGCMTETVSIFHPRGEEFRKYLHK